MQKTLKRDHWNIPILVSKGHIAPLANETYVFLENEQRPKCFLEKPFILGKGFLWLRNAHQFVADFFELYVLNRFARFFT